jgi:hypothetical protein
MERETAWGASSLVLLALVVTALVMVASGA